MAAGREQAPPRLRHSAASPMQIDVKAPPLLETNLLGRSPWGRGKVRDVYDLGDRLLIVATDRLSAFDVRPAHRHPRQGRRPHASSRSSGSSCSRTSSPQPPAHRRRGRLPCALSPRTATARGPVHAGREDRAAADRVRRARLPGGLRLEGLPARRARSAASRCRPGFASRTGSTDPIFTPATKAETGHDENITLRDAWPTIVGGETAAEAARRSRSTSTRRARAHAEARGIILADTKFEFGVTRRRASSGSTRS